MYVVFLALWVIFNGRVTVEIVLFGLVIAAGMDFFLIKFMNYNPRKTLLAVGLLPHILRYILVLFLEICKANVQTMRLVYSAKYEIEPLLVTFRPALRTNTARVVLANSITLTPGTISVTLTGDELVVHCLDRDFSEGLENCAFVTLLQKMERNPLIGKLGFYIPKKGKGGRT